MDKHDGYQRGSSSVVALASMIGLSAAYMVVSRITGENVQSIQKARTENTNQDDKRIALNGISVAKALLSPRNVGSGEPTPAVVAVDYYESIWKIASAKAESGEFELLNSRTFSVSLPYVIAPEFAQVSSIMRGKQTFFDQKTPIKVDFRSLKTNFDSKGRQALSVDVQAKSKGKDLAVARINLAPVAPHNVKVQYKKTGESTWNSIPSQIDSGKYDFRILASGIAFDGEAYLNGTKVAEFGGFDDSGKIRHKAVSYNSVDEEVGRFTYDLSGKTFDTGTCAVSAVSGTYTLNVVVNGPADTDETKQSVSVAFKTAQPPKPELSYDEYMSSCKEQCPYLAPPTEDVDRAKYGVLDRDEQWKKKKFGDYTIDFMRDVRRFEILEPDVRLCMDDRKLAEEFKKVHGRYYVSNDDYYSSPDYENFGQYQDFIAYAPPKCEREFVFTRNSCGCFDPSTKIRLGNNRDEKAISELTREDSVWNPVLKKAFRIRKMVRGPEKTPMFQITTVDSSLNVTRYHPMLTTRGIIPAFEVKDDDQVKIDGNSWTKVAKVSEISFEEEPIVWNLELEGDDNDDSHFVLANGMITGDLLIQKKIQAREGN